MLRLFLFLLLSEAINSEMDIRIKCPLKWVEFDNGFAKEQVPSTTISSRANQLFISKISTDQGNFIGMVKSNDMTAYIPILPASSAKYRNYQILTNPYECIFLWVEKNHLDVSKFGLHNGLKIGRSSAGFIPGHLVLDTQLAFVDNDENYKTTVNYQILISYRPGVTLKISNFELAIEPNSEDGALDFIGLDEITNNADVTIVQTVTHTKRVSETVSFSESSFSSKTTSVSHSFGIHIGDKFTAGISVDKSNGKGQGSSDTISNTTERMVSVSREVVVPPYTSISVCSTISNNDKYNSSYTARAEFSSPGLSANEIVTHLQGLNVGGPFTKEGLVVSKKINGTIAATLAMETQFIIVPKDSNRGCEGLAEESTRRKKNKITENASKILKQIKNKS